MEDTPTQIALKQKKDRGEGDEAWGRNLQNRYRILETIPFPKSNSNIRIS